MRQAASFTVAASTIPVVQYYSPAFCFLTDQTQQTRPASCFKWPIHAVPAIGMPMLFCCTCVRLYLYPVVERRMYTIYQWLSFKLDPSHAWDLRRRTEIIPGKHSARIKPLPLTNGHGRYITVTPERTPVSVGEWPLHISITVTNF
jgi:hypothetical protein